MGSVNDKVRNSKFKLQNAKVKKRILHFCLLHFVIGTLPFALCLLLSVLAGQAQAGDKATRVKFATLAPEGSTWMKVLRDLDEQVKADTQGRVSFKFYPGGVSGDEKDVIRKMRIGQIHAAGFTGVGLGEILPEVRVLDLPFLFENAAEIEHIYQKMTDYFAGKFEEKGYVLLGWVPVGWIHFFSQQEIRTLDDLRTTKAWMWEGDPLVQEAYKVINVTPYPLSITDVLMSLQTGLIKTIYASPLGALAFQWFTKVKYMSRIRMGYGTGGVLMVKKKFDALADEDKAILKDLSRQYLGRLVQDIKRDNDKSIEVMMNSGVALASMPSRQEIDKFREAGKTIRNNLTGRLFSRELLDTVLSHLKEAR